MYVVQNLSKFYSKQEVLRNINMKIEPGQLVGLLGKNGSGKSTLMRLLAQKEVFSGGEILYRDESLRRSDLNINQDLVYVAEDQILPTHKPISDWVEVFQNLYSQYDLEVWNFLKKDLDLDCSKSFFELSRGQKMKTWFALNAPRKPMIYILDEITSVLDSGSRLSTMRFLEAERSRGAVVIISTNIASELQGFATHVGLLSDMELALFCKVEDLQKNFIKLRGIQAQKIEGAKPVHLNSDGSWSYLAKKEAVSAQNIEESFVDRRGVTIEDVASYYSMRVE